MRILFVDDEADLREVVPDGLRALGVDVDTAANGTLARHLLENHTYDVLVTDLYMPDMDGIELIRVAKSIAPAMPVLVMSGNNKQVHASTLRLGGAGMIRKPFQVQELLDQINGLLAAV